MRELAVKPMPLTVRGKDDAPTEVEAGRMLVMEKLGAVMEKVTVFDVVVPSCAFTEALAG